MEATTMSANEWAEIIALQASKLIDEVPDGWKTSRQISKELNCSLTTVKEKLRPLIQDGKVEVKKFRIAAGSRKAYLTEHYKICK